MTVARSDDRNDPSNHSQLLARYERIIEISNQLNSTLDHVALLRRITAAATELTDTESASILLIEPVTGELRFETLGSLTASETESIVVPMEGSIAGWVVTHGEPRVIEDVSQEPSHFRRVDDQLKFHTRNILGVPMRVHNRTIGALEAVNKRGGVPFNGDDIRTLMTLAGQAAIAIENSRLFQQSDFMSEMVHELRSPLAALKTSMSLLLRDDLPNDRRAATAEIMQNEIDRLIRLTTEFLDLARLESGRIRLDVTALALDRLIVECVDIVKSQAQERDITVETRLEPLIVEGDRAKIKQVVLNLLTNAVKYNRDHGYIQVRSDISLRHDEPFAEIAVTDTGLGIARENQRKLFQKFYRVQDTADVAPGTGLGLAIVKHIIEAHKGGIWLDSEPGKGSTFYVTLPLSP